MTPQELAADLRLNHEYCPKEVILQAAELSLARGEVFVWRETVAHDQAELKTVWGMKDRLAVELEKVQAALKTTFLIEAELRAELEQIRHQEPVAWGVVYFGGKNNGELYTQCQTKEGAEAYIATIHQSQDNDTFRAAPLYRAAGAQPVQQEPVATLNRWLSSPDLGAPERVIYSVKVLDAGRALPMGKYSLYLHPDQPEVCASKPPESDSQDDLTGKGGAQERKGLFIDLIAEHDGLAEEIAWERRPLSVEQIRKLWMDSNSNPDDRPKVWSFEMGVVAGEKAHGIKERTK